MGRLTGWDRNNAYCLKCFEGEFGCEDMETSKCDFCPHHLAVYNQLAAYEDSGLTPEECRELAGAKAEGRLVVLPIKIGKTVWVVEKKLDHRTRFVRERFVNSIGLSTDGYMNLQFMVPEEHYSFPIEDIFWEPSKIGKTIFLTREEAEAALKED